MLYFKTMIRLNDLIKEHIIKNLDATRPLIKL